VAWASNFNSAKYGHDPKYLVGAGPYKFESWEPGQKIVLVKKQNYWAAGSNFLGDKNYPDKIIFKLNKDQNSTQLEFKSQALDVSTFVSMKTLLQLQNDSAFNANYNSCIIANFNYSYVAINTKPDGIKQQKYFTDKNVRRAIALLSPVDDMLSVVYKNKTSRVPCMISAMKKEYNHDLAILPYNIEQAKKILDDAGWKDTNNDGIRDKIVDGKLVSMHPEINVNNAVVDWKDLAQMMVEGFKKAGIDLKINVLDQKVLIENAKQHHFDLFMGSWGGVSAADDLMQAWGSMNWANNGSNYTGFGNATTDALIDSCRYTVDEAKRITLVKRFQKIVYDEQPYIFLFSGTRRAIIHKRFGNAAFYIERPSIALNNLKLLTKK
jgi:peptide/nickel transport system substrate-binding protein